MKQLIKLGMLLAFGGVMASCSNDKLDNPEAPEVNKGTTYAAFNIAMPSQAGTKADPTLDDGDVSEYTVKEGKVILFKAGSSVINEDDFVYATTGSLNTMAWAMYGDKDDQITTQSKTAIATFEGLSIPTDTENEYYALVVLNPNSLTLPTTGQTFGKWRTTAQSNETTTAILGQPTSTSDSETKGMTMTNAPQYKSSAFSTLVKIQKDKVSTVSDNNLSPAAEIYVQRLAAKVEIKRTGTTKWTDDNGTVFDVEYPAGVNSGTKDKVKITAWGLDYTNTTTFPVQIANTETYSDESFTANDATNIGNWISANNKATFVSTGAFGRIYWAVDPNYSSTAQEGDLYHTTDVTANPSNKSILYCMENTMTPKQMLRDQTTTVVVKGEYMIEGNSAVSFVSYGNVKQTIPGTVTLKDNIKSSKSKKYLAELFELNSANSGDEAPKTVHEAFGLIEDVQVDFYLNGVVYYAVPIYHFIKGEETTLPENFVSADDYTDAQTGRFGVVRNNWYEVNINKITGLGDPEVPTPDPKDPDDPSKQYVDITINIVAWAKRPNNYDL